MIAIAAVFQGFSVPGAKFTNTFFLFFWVFPADVGFLLPLFWVVLWCVGFFVTLISG